MPTLGPLLLLLIGTVGVGVKDGMNPLPADTQDLHTLIERYTTDRDSLGSFYSTPQSELGLTRREKFAKDWLASLGKVDFGKLAQDGKVDYLLIKDELEDSLRSATFQRKRNLETVVLTPFAKTIVTLEETRWKVEPVDPEKAAATLTDLAKEVKEVHKQVQAGLEKKKGDAAEEAADESDQDAKAEPIVVDQVLAYRGSKAVHELKDVLERWFKHYDGFKPLFSWWNRKPYESARKELDDYEKFLKETVAGVKDADDDPLIGDPIGREAILDDLKHEMIPYSPEELVDIAKKEFAWCEVEMKRASQEMGFGDDWKKALEKVKQDHVGPGEQDDLVAKQARDAIAFVDKRDLVTIEDLCRETWRVDMLDARGQRFLPFAAYGGQKMLVSYPLDSMDNETKQMSLRGNNIHFTRIVTPHELIPGHHLQGYMAQRYRSYRGVFSTPFLIEGWALYWEMLLWDLGYAQSPENRVGMLFWRMHRCARIIVSLDFHLGKMKPKEMIDFLVDRVGHERFTATSEVRRFIGGDYSPLYQCAYMIGGLQLRALSKDLVGSGKMTLKQFHDAVLHENSIPIEMIRAKLANTPLAKDWVPGWKFYGAAAGTASPRS